MATLVALVLSHGPTAAHEADRQPMVAPEQIGRAEAEHDDRVPVDAITQPAPSGPREVLVHGQRVDVPIPRRSRFPMSSGEWRGCVARNHTA